MHRIPLALKLVCIALCPILLVSSLFGQKKPAGEVDVTRCWSHTVGETPATTLASDADRIFLGQDGSKVEALANDGNRVWSTELGGEITSNILPSGGGLFLVTSAVSVSAEKSVGSTLRSLSRDTGITNWTINLPGDGRYFLGEFNGAVIAVSTRGIIHSIDAKSGAVKWKREIAEGFTAEPTFAAGKVYIASTAKQIFSVSTATGEIDSVRKSAFGVTAIAVSASGDLIAGDERGNVGAFVNGSVKPRWKFKSGGEISVIIVTGENILIASHDNFLYFLSARYGGVGWKKRLSGRPAHIAAVPNRFVLIAAYDEPGALILDLFNGKVAGQIITGADERLSGTPVIADRLVVTMTNTAVHAYSLNGCSPNKTRRQALSPPPRFKII